MATLTKGVALALADDAMRKSLRAAMLASRFREHKTDVRPFLSTDSLGLRSSISRKTLRSSPSLLALLDSVTPLEFYMPVEGQLASWNGSDDLVVATQLFDFGQIIAFNLRGESVLLDPMTAPKVPVLVVVPQETDFGDPSAVPLSNALCTEETCGGGGG